MTSKFSGSGLFGIVLIVISAILMCITVVTVMTGGTYTQRSETAQSEGYAAAKNEIPYQLCPYACDSPMSGHWRRGYSKYLLDARDNPFVPFSEAEDSEFADFDD